MKRRALIALIALTTLLLTSLGAATGTAAPGDPPEVLDGQGGPGGRVIGQVGEDTTAVSFNAVPHLFYSISQNGAASDLRLATLGASPSLVTLDGAGGAGGRTANAVGSDLAASVYAGVLHVFYRDDTRGDLRHAWLTGTTWAFETLDGASTVGGRVNSDVGRSMTVTIFANRLEVFYTDVTRMDVRRASFGGGSWAFATIDGNSTAGGRTTHQVAHSIQARIWAGRLHVLYYELDPAYADFDRQGWVKDAALSGAAFTYTRAFRTQAIGLGKTLAVGVQSSTSVIVVHNTFAEGDVALRWRRWNGSNWTQVGFLASNFDGSTTSRALFVDRGGLTTLAFFDVASGVSYWTWTAAGVTHESGVPFSGSPTSSLAVGAGTHIYWGNGATDCCGGAGLLLRTTL